MIVNGRELDFAKVANSLKDTGYRPQPRNVQINIPDARKNLMNGLKYLCGEKAKWCGEYEKIAEWLTDNKGRGLMIAGNCGVGKTLIGMRLLPILINHFCGRIVNVCTAMELNKNPDFIMSKHIIYVDDVGTEDVSNIYGNKRLVFAELVDAAEKNGKLLLFSTNLDDIAFAEKYGDRTIDRLHAIVRKINIQGKSNRS